ncbi:MAG: efflux RND transporter permease subunit [Myxacorys californica WJT36-NPBG1]|jgi:multidrug efflux pump subunit AcrB|nr:efflux RND transporter permease subunit [Myxacorys californica WJT36-NPBG1]
MPVERQVNGVEKIAYISSTSSNDGASSVSTYFETGTDRNINQVNVQNRAAIARCFLLKGTVLSQVRSEPDALYTNAALVVGTHFKELNLICFV